MLKASFLMMLPFPTLTQATMIITKFMVRQRLHHLRELEDQQCMVISKVWMVVA